MKIFNKKEPKPVPSSDFKTSIKEIIKGKDAGSVHIYRTDPDGGSGIVGNFVSKGDARDFDDVDIEPYIKSHYGGGAFNVIVMKLDKSDNVERNHSHFRFNIEGDPLESRYETSKKNKTYQESAFNFAEKALDKMMESVGKDGKGDAILAIIQANQTAMQALFGQIVDIQTKNTETLLRLMDSRRDGDNPVYEALEGILKLNEVKEMLSPNVNSDKTLEWARIFANSPLTAGLASKFLGLEMPAQIQLPMAENKPPGNDDQPALNASSVATPSPPNTQAGPLKEQGRGDFETVMLDPLINLIDSHASPSDIASSVYQIISWTLTMMKAGVEPHPIMTNFVNAMVGIMKGNFDLEPLNIAYNEFARAIEMPKELIDPVKDELTKIYTPMFMQLKKVAEDETK